MTCELVAGAFLDAHGEPRGRRYVAGKNLYPAVVNALGLDARIDSRQPIVADLARRESAEGR
jgi:hypothetical protein